LYRTARVRVRFANPEAENGQEVWDIILSRGQGAVTLDLFARNPTGAAASRQRTGRLRPAIPLYLVVLKRQPSVKFDGTAYPKKAPPEKGLLLWQRSKDTTRPEALRMLPTWTAKRFAALPKGLARTSENYFKRNRTAMAKGLRDFDQQMEGKDI